MSVYAVYGSELHLVLPDDFADTVIRVQERFLRSSQMWETSRYTMSQEELATWNEYADLMNRLIKINGGMLNLPNEVKDALILVKL